MIGIFVGIIFVISSEKLFSNEVIGDTADGPSGHIVVIFGGQSSPGEMLSQISINKLMSESLPLPLAILSKIISSHVVPSLHGAVSYTHLTLPTIDRV